MITIEEIIANIYKEYALELINKWLITDKRRCLYRIQPYIIENCCYICESLFEGTGQYEKCPCNKYPFKYIQYIARLYLIVNSKRLI